MKIYKEFGRNPHADWTTLLVVSIVITLTLGFMSFTLYRAVVGGSIVGDVETSTSFKKLNEKVIEKVIVQFEEKEQARASIRTGTVHTVDPSL